MTIAVIGMLDEREAGLALIKKTIEKRGHKIALIDISIGTGAIKSALKADVANEELARLGGTTVEAIAGMLAKERDKATSTVAAALGKKLMGMLAAGDLQGVIAVGGMTGTFISLSAMKMLPFGLPKLMISSVAAMPAYAKKLAEFFGVRDITVMHSVVDTVGLNPLVRNLMINGAGAICGMVESYEPRLKEGRPAIAITEFGFADKGAHYVRELLEDHFDIISFHATGMGEKAAGDLVGQGLFEAFIDLVPGGFSEYLLGGNRAAGPDRLDAGCRQGKPYILSPCGFDMISCGPIQRRDEKDPLWVSRKLAERKLLLQDSIRVQARTNPEEMKLIAEAVAEKLNRCPNPKLVKFVIPKRGFSSLSVAGGALFDPASDQTFIDELKKNLSSQIEVIEVDTHFNTPEFARAVVAALDQAIRDMEA
ncbi:MAG: Tm-1-like ATP-binding domain-containing protein [Syntrophobacterales bacterium]|nr:Tm-1-like ATP-binding domain-containing protein [Syntrophobacterales bacterium]